MNESDAHLMMFVLYNKQKLPSSILLKFLRTIARIDLSFAADLRKCFSGLRLLVKYTPRSFFSHTDWTTTLLSPPFM